MTKVSVGSGLTVKGRRPSNIRVSEDGAFKGSQPEINFTGDVSVTNDPANNKVTVNITGGSGSVTLASLDTTLQTAAAGTPADADTFSFHSFIDGVLKLVSLSGLKSIFNALYWKTTGTTTLTGNTVVDLNNKTLDFSSSSADAEFNTSINPSAGVFSYQNIYDQNYAFGVSDGTKSVDIALSPNGGAVITSQGNAAMSYGADYSADYTSRSLTDKAYVDNLVTGLLELKGSTDCSANPNYPAGVVGDLYYVTVAGKIGGASGKSVDVGDAYVCKADNAGGTEAAVGTSWFVLEHNLTGVLLAANNLSDLANAATARTNLGAQETLVSATNIKTVNGSSLLGSGNLAVSGGSRSILYKNNVQISNGGSTSEVIVDSFLVAGGTMQANDNVYIDLFFSKSAQNNTFSTTLYVNTSASLVGATQLATYNHGATIRYGRLVRSMFFRNSVSAQTMYSTTAAASVDDYLSSAAAPIALSIDFATDKYFIIAVDGGASDTCFLETSLFEIIRS